MDNVELVCIVCKKENRGSGVWSYHDNPSSWQQEDGLCSDCRQELFPEFGKGHDRSARRKFSFGRLLHSIANQFRFGVDSAH
jgi:hypothetical protein